jgi:hypothetical protein
MDIIMVQIKTICRMMKKEELEKIASLPVDSLKEEFRKKHSPLTDEFISRLHEYIKGKYGE